MYQALYRKYRPRTFDDVAGQEHITKTLKNQMESSRTSHAYLFVGTRGTGKTTCAKILARAVNCERPSGGNPCNECPTCLSIETGQATDVLEIDAASNNGVDNVRALRDEAVYSPASAKKRVYIIDEVHMLSGAAFNALLKILEEPPEHLLFILATTELHKVPATVVSRCQRFSFRRLSRDVIADRLLSIASLEKMELSDEAAELISRLSDGSMRDAISLLDQCSGVPVVDLTRVRDVIGLPAKGDASRMLTAVAHRDAKAAFTILDELYMSGKQAAALFEELSDLARDALVASIMPGADNLLSGAISPDDLKLFAKSLKPSRLTYILTTLVKAGGEFTRGTGDKIIAEIYLASLCDERLETWPEAIVSRLEALESGGLLPVAVTETVVDPVSESAQKYNEPEDLPPWDMPGSEPTKSPKYEEPLPERKPVIAEAPKPEHAQNTDIWAKILSSLPASLSAAISNSSAVLENGMLKISTGSAFAHSCLEKESTIQKIREAGLSIFGHEIGVSIGFTESSPDVQVKLDDLSERFGDLMKFE